MAVPNSGELKLKDDILNFSGICPQFEQTNIFENCFSSPHKTLIFKYGICCK